MMTRTLLLIGCAGLLSAPAEVNAESDRTTICHRTGAPARTPGLFQGQIIEVAPAGVAMHVPGHGDVVIPPTLRARFGSSRICQMNAAGALFDASGKPVQSTGWSNEGADPFDPG